MQGEKEKEGGGGRRAGGEREDYATRTWGVTSFGMYFPFAMRITEENQPAESIFTSLFAFLPITRLN